MINFVVIVVFILIGVIAKRSALLPEATSNWLTQFVIFICLPSIVFVNVPKMSLQPSVLLAALTPWFGVILMGLVVVLVGRIFAWSKAITGCLLMVSCFSNSSFFGFPMVTAFWGVQGLPYAIIYDLVGSFLSLAIIGNIILAIYSGNEDFSWRKTLTRVVTFPPFIAILLAVFLTEQSLPDWLQELFGIISLMLVPATMMLVGMHMSLSISAAIRVPLMFALLLKLIILPLVIALAIGVLPDFLTSNQLANQVTVFEAAMPPMVTASVLAIHARLEPKLAASAVGIGLIVSCLTLPLWYLLLS